MTAGELLDAAARRLAAAGIEAPLREARLLLAAMADLPATRLIGWPEQTINAETVARFDAALDRRAAHTPLSRLLGRREFWSLDFALGPDTLDPRPDSETVVAAALDHLPATARFVADLGSGSGCLLLAILSERPELTGIGVDLAPGAPSVARRNAIRLGLGQRSLFVVGDWSAPLGPPIDLVVANPPYIARDAIAGLDPEVRDHDPTLALDGGTDGLDAYRALARSVGRVLAPQGIVVLELGQGQAEVVTGLFAAEGFGVVELRPDLAGIPRALVLGRR